MKNLKYIIAVIFLFVAELAFACEACKQQQPRLTQGFTHGTGPDSRWDWLIVAVIALITVYTLIYSIKSSTIVKYNFICGCSSMVEH